MKTADFNKLLIEEHKSKGAVLLESICHDLTKEQRQIVEGIYKTFEPLMEVALKPEQIQQVFQQVNQAKGNRTLLGKGVDAAKQVDDAVNKVGKWLQNTTPVQGFDQKFEQLKSAVSKKFPALDKNLTALGTWAKENPGKTAAIIGVLTTLAALPVVGGATGGLIAGQILRGVTGLIKGEKLSTAIGQGLKAAAYGWLAGKSMEAIGSMITRMAQTFNMVPLQGSRSYFEQSVGIPGARDISATGKIIGTNSQVTKFNDMFTKATELWQNKQYDQASTLFDQSLVYAKQVTDATLKATGGQWDKSYNNLQTILQGLSSAAQGAATGATAMDKQGKPATDNTATPAQPAPSQAESRKPKSLALTESQIRAVFDRVARLNSRMLAEGRLEEGIWDDIKSGASKGLQGIKSMAGKAVGAVAQGAAKVGRSMTAKVTSDALTKAWQAAGSPTDSAEIEKLLQAQGVNPEVVKTVFQANSIPLSVAAAASTGSAGVDANEPMPDVMSTNRAEPPAPAEPATASAGPGAQVAQQQAPQQSIQQPASAEPTASQGAVAQGVQQAQSQQQQPSATASKLPDVTRLTPEQKKQLLAQIDKQLASMPAAIAQQPTPPAPQPPAPTAPTQSATANKMPASTTPVATTQQAVAAKMPVATKTAKPKVPYSAVAQKAQPAKVSAARNPGAPTDTEYNKFQDLLKQALDKQGA
jgi:hypothetical protein